MLPFACSRFHVFVCSQTFWRAKITDISWLYLKLVKKMKADFFHNLMSQSVWGEINIFSGFLAPTLVGHLIWTSFISLSSGVFSSFTPPAGSTLEGSRRRLRPTVSILSVRWPVTLVFIRFHTILVSILSSLLYFQWVSTGRDNNLRWNQKQSCLFASVTKHFILFQRTRL